MQTDGRTKLKIAFRNFANAPKNKHLIRYSLRKKQYMHSISTVYPQYVHSTSTVYPQYIHSTSTLYPQYIHSISKAYPQYIHKLPLQRTLHRLPLENAYDFSISNILTPKIKFLYFLSNPFTTLKHTLCNFFF